MNGQLKLAYIAAVLNATIVGFSFLFAKVALTHASALDTIMYRFALSFIVLTIPVAFGWIKLNYRGKSVYKLLPLFTIYPLAFLFQAFGLQRATSSEGGILFAFVPILTVVLAFFWLKETTTAMQKLSILVSVSGVVFIFLMKGSVIDWANMAGIGLLFLSCVLFAGHSVFAKSQASRFSPMEITYLLLGFGFVIFLSCSIVNHAANDTIHDLAAPLSNGKFLAAIAYLGILSSLGTAFLSSYSLSKIEASRNGVFSNLSTVVSIAAGAIFLGEAISIYSLLGALLILAGVTGTNLLGRKRTAAAASSSKHLQA